MKKLLFLVPLLCTTATTLTTQLLAAQEHPQTVPGQTLQPAAADTLPPYLNESLPLDLRVADALSRMTLEEKVRLVTAQSKFSSPGVPRLGIPELWMSDGPHGVREEILWDNWNAAGWTNDSCTAFPALTCLAATWNPAMAALYGGCLGEEARYRRKDVMLGPGCNIYRTPLNGRNFEYLGEDPCLASAMVVPYIRSLQANGVAACVKHFALNNQETWRGHIDVELSDRALHEIYLPAFRAAVVEGEVWSVMGSYNKVRGAYACENSFLLDSLLKRDWGFDGCVVSDWGATHDTDGAVYGGLDIEMGSYTDGVSGNRSYAYDEYYLSTPYLNGLRNGTYPLATIDDKAARVLRLIFRTAMNSRRPWGSFTSEAHYAAARRIAEEGMVLLKNDPVGRGRSAAPLLPIDTTRYRRILVVGDNAVRRLCSGGGASGLKVQREVVPLEALQAAYGEKIGYTRGYACGEARYGKVDRVRIDSDSLYREALRRAAEADLVIFVGGLNKNHQQDCEAGDRIEYNLPFGQDSLIPALAAVNPHLVLVLIGGNAVEMSWHRSVPAILQAWYGGSEGGTALARILSGEVNPGGRLPFSFPISLSDCGAHSFDALCYPGDSIREVYREGILVGYRWYDTRRIPVLFPFGHGLSYTTFRCGKPQISANEMSVGDTMTIVVPVTNTGGVAGSEVVQLYVGADSPAVERPLKELKGFAKISLAPSETGAATFSLTPDDFAYYDDARGEWRTDAGRYTLYIGTSATDILYKVRVVFKE